AMIPIRNFEDGEFLTFVTRNGLIKKTDIMDYSRIRNGGLRAIELNEGDELIGVYCTDGEREVLVATHNGMAVKFSEKNVRSMGRTTRGVRAIRLREGDFVVGACIVDYESKLFLVTENGYGKKVDFAEYRLQSRGGKGIYTYRLTEKTGKLSGIRVVTDENDVMIMTSAGIIIRMHADEISTLGRYTQGVRVMRLAEGVNIASLAITERDDEEETVAPEAVEEEEENIEEPIEEDFDDEEDEEEESEE
ncbi:MAG: DNA gyrase subunit A, partial [Clostridia bacterium]|nr:DNA gyrase subunit A [Clostridia bacterium]